jgi:hypothetical protein
MSAMPMRRIDAPRRRHGSRGGTDTRMIARTRRSWRFRARATGHPMERRDGYSGLAEAAAVIDQRPQLRVVPRRRLAANAAALAIVLIGVLMLAAVVLHTRLAERQLEIDRLEQQVANEHVNFDVLRQQRAELRAPTRLATAGQALGMMQAYETEFAAVDPHVLARVLAATGTIDESDGALVVTDPLDQVQRVRAAESGAEYDAGVAYQSGIDIEEDQP